MRRDWNSDFQFEIVSHISWCPDSIEESLPPSLLRTLSFLGRGSLARYLSPSGALQQEHACTLLPLSPRIHRLRLTVYLPVSPALVLGAGAAQFCPSVSLSTLNAALLWSLYTRRSCLAHSSYTCSFSKPPTFARLSSHTSSSSLSLTRLRQFLPLSFYL